MNLWQDFLINDEKVIQKWVHYFPAYEKHFSSWRNKSLTFLEIGVSKGGSLQMWQRYFGPMAKIVGIDVNEKCVRHEAPGIFVRIGNQSDVEFLQSVIIEFGVPDIVLDDGSHHMSDLKTTFEFLYPQMHKNAIYMVEDLHTAYWDSSGGGVKREGSFIEFTKDCIDKLNAHYTYGKVPVDYINKQTFGISIYDSIVCFEKGDVFRREAPKTGKMSLGEKFGINR